MMINGKNIDHMFHMMVYIIKIAMGQRWSILGSDQKLINIHVLDDGLCKLKMQPFLLLLPAPTGGPGARPKTRTPTGAEGADRSPPPSPEGRGGHHTPKPGARKSLTGYGQGHGPGHGHGRGRPGLPPRPEKPPRGEESDQDPEDPQRVPEDPQHLHPPPPPPPPTNGHHRDILEEGEEKENENESEGLGQLLQKWEEDIDRYRRQVSQHLQDFSKKLGIPPYYL